MSVIISDQSMQRGQTAALDITVSGLGSGGLGAYTDARFTAKHDPSDADSAAVISKTLGAGVSVQTNGNATTNGVLRVSLAPADTNGLPTGYASILVYDVWLYDGTGDGWPVAQGTLTVAPSVTQAGS